MNMKKVREWKIKEGMEPNAGKRLKDGRMPKRRSRHVAGKGSGRRKR